MNNLNLSNPNAGRLLDSQGKAQEDGQQAGQLGQVQDAGQARLGDEEAQFISKYVFDPGLFVEEIFNTRYDPWQQYAADALLRDHFVTIRSGNGVGKTFFEATILWWFLMTRYMAQIPCTANSAVQLKSVLWSQVARLQYQSDYLVQRARVTEDMVQVVGYEKAWFAVARTAQNNKGDVQESLQGFHGEFVLFLVDEASGVPDKTLDALESAATGEDSYGLMCSNATRRSGLFFRSWHQDRDIWSGIHVKHENTTRVSPKFVTRMEKRYGGKNTNGYKIRVLGEFPRQSDMGLLSEVSFDASEVQMHELSADQIHGDVCMSVDPAGDAPEADACTMGLKIGKAIVEIRENRSMDLSQVADQLVGWAFVVTAQRLNLGLFKQTTIPVFIDVIGLGIGLAQELERRQQDHNEEFGGNVIKTPEGQSDQFENPWVLNPIRVNVGKAATKPEEEENDLDLPEAAGASGREIYLNLRAELFCHLADLIRFKRIMILEQMDMLREDLCGLQKEYTTNGKIKIQSKKEFRSLNDGRSTDWGDAAALLFVDDVGAEPEVDPYDADVALYLMKQNVDTSSEGLAQKNPLMRELKNVLPMEGEGLEGFDGLGRGGNPYAS